MTEKARILDSLGERTLLLPSLVNLALAANDRVKYRFSLLQAAQAHAEHPDAPTSSLRAERLAAGVLEITLDQTVGGAQKLDGDLYHIPGSARLLRDITGDVASMLEPLQTARTEQADGFARRLRELQPPTAPDDELSAAQIHALTSGTRDRGDSLHLLVMDLHLALNALQAQIAGESIDGCRSYAIAEADRPRVAAFMAGVNRTAPLKFNHPGLAATATRVGERLVLQNDIGATDAHVLVVHIRRRTATVTYTDVHLRRLRFFQGLLEDFPVEWSETRSRSDTAFTEGLYHLCVGTFRARSETALRAFLEHLGSRLVFLIDWNRARKRLRQFVPRAAALELLAWAARENIGHMAWLEAGGEQLVFDAMSFAYAGQVKPGERLDSLLTESRAVDFLRFNLTRAFEGLRQGRPISLLADEIRTELASLVRSTEDALLDTALEQAGLIVELADTVRGALTAMQAGHPEEVAAMAELAKDWETAADRELNNARESRRDGELFLVRVMSAADDVADGLEEATFHLTLSPRAPVATVDALLRLVEHVSGASRELVKALAGSRYARRGVPRGDIGDFLQAVHAIGTLEHASDLAEREVKRSLSLGSQPFSEVFGAVEAARNLEEAADNLMHVALLLRDNVMQKVGHA